MTNPTAPSAPGRPANAARETAALSRELSDFLVELSIALHKHAIYPPGHPLLTSAVDRLLRKVLALLQDRATVSLGVARKQLVIEGVATAADNALLRELAERLHHHHLGALRFARGLERDELADFLATVAVDPGRTAQPIGLAPAQLLPAWSHVRIFPLAYEQLALVEEEERAKGGDPAAPAPPPSNAPQLWVGLAQVALALDSAKAGEAAAAEPGAVARAIDARPREQA
ncbi:MAG TPA: hypothetical protein VNA89_15475, partial [Gemmatimonadaceae bacterium]|nr:hypothetical protein [Gemmatimonadaceae bacterium]